MFDREDGTTPPGASAHSSRLAPRADQAVPLRSGSDGEHRTIAGNQAAASGDFGAPTTPSPCAAQGRIGLPRFARFAYSNNPWTSLGKGEYALSSLAGLREPTGCRASDGSRRGDSARMLAGKPGETT